MTRWLLEHGADVAKPDRAGEPPLMIAAHAGDRAGRESAARPRRRGRRSRRERSAKRRSWSRFATSVIEVAKLLLDSGADANAQTTAAAPPRFIPPSESPKGLSRGIGIIRAGWPDGRGKRFPAAGSKTPLLYAARAGDARADARCSWSTAPSSKSPTATASRR